MAKSETTLGARVALLLFAAPAIIGYFAYVGAASSWQYYVLVDEIVADAPGYLGKRVRVSGRVAEGSLAISELRREAVFELRGKQHGIQASCQCAVPDNLAEGIDVVVEGVLQTDGVQGHRIITRCASKYEPKSSAIAQHNVPDEAHSRTRTAKRPMQEKR